MERSKDRREYLMEKSLDGARALYDFFEGLRNDPNCSSEEFVSRLTDQYELTPNQQILFGNIALRASRARGIVKYFEDRFGLDEDNYFQDPHGVYECLTRKNSPKNISAVSGNIAIGFIRGRWGRQNYVGIANGVTTAWDDLLIHPLKETISRLDNGKTTACGDVTYSLPNMAYFERLAKKRLDAESDEKRLVRSMFGRGSTRLAEEMSVEVENHEFRHVIDRIIGVAHPFGEFVADLYGVDYSNEGLNENVFWGLERDSRKRKSSLSSTERIKGLIAEFEKTGLQSAGVDKLRRIVVSSERDFDNFLSAARGLIEVTRKLPKEDKKMFSYFVSTMGDHDNLHNFADRLKVLEGICSCNSE